MYHYYESGLAPSPPTEKQVAEMLAVTNGNAKELREMASMMNLSKMKALLA